VTISLRPTAPVTGPARVTDIAATFRRTFVIGLSLLIALLGLRHWVDFGQLLKRPQERVADFAAYHKAAIWVREGGVGQLYPDAVFSAAVRDDGPGPFANPPYAAIPLLPFAFLSLRTAFLASIALNLFAWAAIGRSLIRRFHQPSAIERWVAHAWFAAYPAAISVVGLGTFGMVVTALLLWVVDREPDEDTITLGLVMSGLLIKPQYVVVPCVILLVHRRWRSIVGFTVGGLIWGIVGLAIGGVSAFTNYLSFSSRFADRLDRPIASATTDWVPKQMPVIRGLLAHLLGTSDVSLINNLSLLALVLGLIAMAAIAHRWSGRRLWIVGCLVMVVTSFHTNPGDTVLLVVPFASWWLLLRNDNDGAPGVDLRRAAFVVLLLAWPLSLTFFAQANTTAMPVPGVLLLVALPLAAWTLRARGLCPQPQLQPQNSRLS
jgi:Glycosyltransferase family 87